MKLRLISAVLILWLAAPPPASAQLTTDQKVVDFQSLAALYAKWYAPYEWKQQLFQYDVLNLAPWLTEIRATTNDLDYLDVLVRYTARLNDSHSGYSIPSSFYAVLGLHVDAYFDAGRKNVFVLIDAIDRNALPEAQYPFETGDELLSVDGTPVAELIARFSKYIGAAAPEERLREAAYYLTVRPQSALPRAQEIGDNATLEIKRKSGVKELFVAPWYRQGTPLITIGPALPVKSDAAPRAQAAADPWEPLKKYRTAQIRPLGILNFGALPPVWDLPSSFQIHLGEGKYDDFYTGVMISHGFRIGYLRIPSFDPSSADEALSQLDSEIQYLEANSDGLVLDVMRNPGGLLCYQEDLMMRVMPGSWRAIGLQMRPDWSIVAALQEGVASARAAGWSAQDVQTYQELADEFRAAYDGNRLTVPSSVCYLGLDRPPAAQPYTKPILLLVDEFSASAADCFAALFQDNQRGKLFGYRTNGAGGSVVDLPVGFYSEFGEAYVTNSLMYRPNAVAANGYALSHTIENAGVQPDVPFDYMQPEVLRLRGKPFVDAFLAELVAELKAAGIEPSVSEPSDLAAQAAAARSSSPPPGARGSAGGGVR